METKTWIYVTLGLIVLACVLQIVGFLVPMWIWLDTDTFTVGVGLWFTMGCGIDNTCNTAAPSLSFGYTSGDTDDQLEFQVVQALETLGTVGGVLVLLFMILYKVGYGRWKGIHHLHLAAFITCIITALCVLVGVLVFCGFYWPVVGTSSLLSTTSFPWSMLMCLFAAVLFIIICLLIRLRCWNGQFAKHAIPVSGASRIDQHPVTQHGLWHRYFTSPYHATRRPNYAVEEQNEGKGMAGISSPSIRGGFERRSVSAIDNVAFNGNAPDYNYRYLPQPTVDPAPLPPPPVAPRTVIRQTLPATLPTSYNADNNASDLDRFRRSSDYTAVARSQRVIEEPPIDGDGPRRSLNDVGNGLGGLVTTRDVTGYYQANGAATRDVTGYYQTDGALTRNVTGYPKANGAATRDVTGYYKDGAVTPDVTGYYNDGAVTRDVTGYYDRGVTRGVKGFYNDGGVTRDVTYGTRYVTTRQSFMPLEPVGGGWPQDRAADREPQELGPIITSARASYIAGVTDPPLDRILSNNTLDSRFTMDGRLTANADYLHAQYRRGEKALSQVGSNHSSSALQYTTHLGPLGPPARSVAEESVARMFHPTHIYRPSTKQMY